MSELFPLGQVLCTPLAWQTLKRYDIQAKTLLDRHVSGDWSDMTESDAEENRVSIEKGYFVSSSFIVSTDDDKIWIITEGDRSSTMILLPKEYDAMYSD